MSISKNTKIISHEVRTGNLNVCISQMFQVSTTVCHCLTNFIVKIQLDHFCIGDGTYIDVHKLIWA